MNPAELGCAVSHCEVWRKIVDEGSSEYFLVLEDDVDSSEKGDSVFVTSILKKVSKKGIVFDLMYLYRGPQDSCSEDLKLDQETILLQGETDPHDGTVVEFELTEASACSSTAAYIITKDFAKKLFNSGFNKTVFNIDDFLNALNPKNTNVRPDILNLKCVRDLRPTTKVLAFKTSILGLWNWESTINTASDNVLLSIVFSQLLYISTST